MSEKPQSTFSKWFLGERSTPEPAIETQAFAATPVGILPPLRSDTDLTLTSSLGLTAIYASLRTITSSCSQLELGAFRNGEEIPTPLILRQPDADRSRSAFVKRAVTSLFCKGNAYFAITRNARGEAINIRVLDPNTVTVQFSDKGVKSYDIAGADGTTRNYSEKFVQHLRLMEIPGTVLGLGPIEAGRAGLINARDVRDYAGNFFLNGGSVPRGVLTTDQELDVETQSSYAESFNGMLENNNSLAVLGKGLKYEGIFLSPQDAQWLEAQNFNVLDISRLTGVPPVFLSAAIEGNSLTYTNLDMVSQILWRSCLQSYLTEIEDALSLILPRGTEVKFALDGLLKTDEYAQAQTDEINIRSGVVTVDEVRARKGLAPLTKKQREELKPTPEPVQAPAPDPAPAAGEVA